MSLRKELYVRLINLLQEKNGLEITNYKLLITRNVSLLAEHLTELINKIYAVNTPCDFKSDGMGNFGVKGENFIEVSVKNEEKLLLKAMDMLEKDDLLKIIELYLSYDCKMKEKIAASKERNRRTLKRHFSDSIFLNNNNF